ncbi:ser-Thr-rich glycosyl-phosphatidyl-inositol-anchored membrane family protein [archaeon BMS3Abin16]|nr:ser-Thr-rich glycosyl-phosphatidyl-inositol-anchored membrane family protein [archaeon BMS3Abin16]
MKACSILLVAAIMGGLLTAGCLSDGTGNGQHEIKKGLAQSKIRLLSPVGGKNFSGVVEIRWQTNDTTGPAKVDIYYTTDPKPFCPACPPQEWHALATGLENTGVYEWNTAGQAPSDLYMIKVKLITDNYVVEDTIEDAFSIA